MSEPVTTDAGRRWLVRRIHRPHAPVRLYCFAHAGGSVGEYVRWSDDLPGIDVAGVQLPGRGGRSDEPAATLLPSLVRDVIDGVEFRSPFALFGHSLGGLMAFEVARGLVAAGREPPRWLVVSACPPPRMAAAEADDDPLSDMELLDRFERRYGDLPAEFRDDAELRATVLQPYRADMELLRRYEYTVDNPLPCSLLVTSGIEDKYDESTLAEWREQAAGSFLLRRFAGGHFYLRGESRRPLLNLIIAVITA